MDALGWAGTQAIPFDPRRLFGVDLWFGDSAVMIADEFPEVGVLSPQASGRNLVVLHFSTTDVEALWKRATEAGAEVVQPLQDQFWGDRYGQIRDPFGYRWGLAQHVRDVSPEEITRIAGALFGGQTAQT